MASPNPSFGDDLPSLQVNRTSNIPTFSGRLPDPGEVVQWGGKPGCQYAFVLATKLGQYMRQGWLQVRDLGVLAVEGPKGSADIFVVVRGKPITSADPANGIRPWFYDPAIFDATGLETPYPAKAGDVTAPSGAPVVPSRAPKPTLNRA